PCAIHERVAGAGSTCDLQPRRRAVAGRYRRLCRAGPIGRVLRGVGMGRRSARGAGWGDESWVGEMDDLFAAAADAFLAGDLALARDADVLLVGAFDLEQEVGTFCASSCPLDIGATDVAEAVAPYLLAVCGPTPVPGPAQQA